MSMRRNQRNTAALAAVCVSALMLGLEISSIPAILPITQPIARRGPIFDENSMPPTDGTIR